MKRFNFVHLVFSFFFCSLLLMYGCNNDNNGITPSPQGITELHTNGTFVANSPSQIQGTLFINDQNGNPIVGVTSQNVTARLNWNNPLDTGVSLGTVIIINNNQTGGNVAGAVTMDYSGSMTSQQISCMENGVITYIDSMKTNDITEIIKFSSTVAVVQPFTSDKTLLRNAVTGSYSGGGSTALYSSIYKGIQDVIPQASNLVKAVVAFTDGEENYSTITRSQLISYALTNGIPVYTVGLLSDTTSSASKDLKNIADTSGAFYFWKNPNNCSNLYQIYATISGQLAGSYGLTVNWQGNLPPTGTTVWATLTTNYANLSSSFTRSYILP
ncbi:MAG TPA: VWA domain-containing protein [Ignavibacteria bacterium]